MSYQKEQYVLMMDHTIDGRVIENGVRWLCKYLRKDPEDEERVIVLVVDSRADERLGQTVSVPRRFTTGWEPW